MIMQDLLAFQSIDEYLCSQPVEVAQIFCTVLQLSRHMMFRNDAIWVLILQTILPS